MIRSTKFNYLLDFQVDFVKPLIKHFKCSLTLIAFKGTYKLYNFSFAIQKLRVSILTNIKLISLEYRNCSCFAKAKIIKLS